ncbi:oxygenase MpaB family protein [Amycolatopsis rhabdoformis]|uniref:Oxygenase MpaB family protein n=1 Tax=Amycolatopsis rhabdoformis TaxID=1448059 RepID=A0ABZ1I3A7_9PSEU|nr:oxygenase MpaB family protein [Amycolatopsis rhabdoformis]WSE28888.1 oxygenase MpaB family protein [Amycolatopsis rhabdoformis]
MAPPVVRGTAAWRYFGDFRDVLLAGQVLVLQVAHPVVAAGVRDHSNYTEDPWTRLMRTGASLSIYVYGGASGAHFEAARLRDLHRTFTGVAEGRRYSGLDPAAYAWVHATLVRVPVDVQRFFGRPLTDGELDEYYAQMCDIGRVLGVRERDLPPDWASFEAYYDEMVASFRPNPTMTTLFSTIRTVPKPVRWLPDRWWPTLRGWQARGQMFLIRATLPSALREQLGLQWTVADERRFRRFCWVVRVVGGLVPVSVRTVHMRWIGKLNVWLREHPWAYRLLS